MTFADLLRVRLDLCRIRSCVRRILLAATICMAFVIFCVLFTLLIFCADFFAGGHRPIL